MLSISDRKFKYKYQRYGIKVKIEYFDHNSLSNRYVILNNNYSLPHLAFIHGAPGYLDEFRSYYQKPEVHSKFRILAIERPGYGYSQPGKAVTSISSQAALFSKILQRESNQPFYLFGHSYGGAICCKIAADHPELVRGLILLAPALDPDQEIDFWSAHLVKTWFNRFIPKPMQVAAQEKLAHISELENIEKVYPLITQKVWFFHGKLDLIVPFGNLKYAQEKFSHAKFQSIVLPYRNHFINIFPPKAVLRLLDQLQKVD